MKIAGLSLLIAIFALGFWAGRRSMKPSGASEAMAKIETARVQAIEAAAAPPAGGPPPMSGANRLKAFKTTLREAAEKLSGDERKPLLAASMQEMLKLLDREWTSWRTDERGVVIFDHEDAVKEFETLQGELTAAAARHDGAEKKLIERAAKSQKP